MLSNLNLNLLQAVGFGLKVKMHGVDYVSVIRWTDRIFLAVKAEDPWPAQIHMIQADLAVEGSTPSDTGDGATGTGAGAGQKGMPAAGGQGAPEGRSDSGTAVRNHKEPKAPLPTAKDSG